MYKLVIKDDESNKTVIAFYRQEITIGREEGNTIRLTEQNVSRQHARLSKSNNLIFLEDLNSYVGTFLNEEEIEQKEQLSNGDEIKIGDYLITIINEGEDNDETVLIKDNDDKKSSAKKIKPVPVSEITGKKSNKQDLDDDLNVSYPLKPPYNKIVFQDSNLAGTSFDILKSVMTIGKSPEADIMITNKSLADIEAKIICNENSVKIKDMTKKGKLKINGDPYTILDLRESDIISLSSSVSFRYCDKNSKYVYKASGKSGKGLKLGILLVILLAIGAGVAILVTGGSKKKVTKEKEPVKQEKTVKDQNKTPEKKVVNKEDTTSEEDLSPQMLNMLSTGRELVRTENWEKAEPIYAKILKTIPNNKEAKENMAKIKEQLKYKSSYHQAIQLFHKKKYEKSIELFQSIPEDNVYRKQYEAKRKQGYLREVVRIADNNIKARKYKESLELLAVADSISPENDDILKRIAHVEKQINRKPRKRVKPKRNRTLAITYFKEGRALIQKQQHQAAIGKLNKARKADPTYADTYMTLAVIYKSTIKNKSLAIKNFKAYLRYGTNPSRRNSAEKWLKELQ